VAIKSRLIGKVFSSGMCVAWFQSTWLPEGMKEKARGLESAGFLLLEVSG